MQWIDALKLVDSQNDRGEGAANHPQKTRLQPGRAYNIPPQPAMQPENPLDWIAFIFLLLGAFAWGYAATQVNILTAVLSRIWDPLDELVFVLIASRECTGSGACSRGDGRGKRGGQTGWMNR